VPVTIGEAVVLITADGQRLKATLQGSEGEVRSFGQRVSTTLQNAVSVGLGNLASRAIAGLTQELGDRLKSLATAAYDVAVNAAPLEGIIEGFAISAAKAGKSTEEFLAALKAASGGMVAEVDLMKAANVAMTGAQGAFAEEFGAALPTLLQAAQVAARRTGQDVTFLFNSLVSGVKRSSPLLIDNTGIVLKLGAANEAMAAATGKTVEELSEQEKQLALLRATMEAANAMIAESGDAALSAGQKYSRWLVFLRDTRDEIGLRLQPALGRLMDGLQALGDRLGPEIADAAATAGSALLSAAGRIAEEFAGLAGEGEGWGHNLGLQFANGIYRALPFVLGAIQAIGELVSYWLSPGSPPRLLPDLPAWGQSAMQQFLDGFAKADFSALEDFSATISDLLQIKVSAGEMAEEDLASALVGARGGFAEALEQLRENGAVAEEVYARIRAAAGSAGEEVEAFARAYIAASKLGAAQDAYRRVAEEYSERLSAARKAGASQSELRAVRAQRDEALRAERAKVTEAAKSDQQAKDQLELAKLRLGAIRDERMIYDDQARLLARVADAVGTLAGGTDKAAAAAEALAQAQLNLRLAMADTAGKIAILREEQGKYEEGSLEWIRLETQIVGLQQQLQRELEKTGGTAQEVADSIVDSVSRAKRELDKLSLKGPDLASLYPIESILAEAERVKERLLSGLKGDDGTYIPIGEAIAKGIGAGLEAAAEGLRKKLSDLLFGPPGEQRTFDPLGGIAVVAPERSIATWEEIASGVGERIGRAIVDGMETGIREGKEAIEKALEEAAFSHSQTPAESAEAGEIPGWLKPARVYGLFMDSLMKRLAGVPEEEEGQPFGTWVLGRLWGQVEKALEGNVPAPIARLVQGLAAAFTGSALLKNLGVALPGIELAAYAAGQELALEVGVALEAGFGSATAGGVVGGLTAATLIPVIFPEETTSFVDQLYEKLHGLIAEPIGHWFDIELPKKDILEAATTKWFSIDALQALFEPERKGAPLGASLMSGMSEGVDDNVGLLTGSLNQALDDAEAGARTHIEARSPSQVWARVGRDLLQGMIDGAVERATPLLAALLRPVDDAELALGTRPATFGAAIGQIMAAMRTQADLDYKALYEALVKPFDDALSYIKSLIENWPSVPMTPETPPSVPPAYAGGTNYARGGLAIVGEYGRELVRLPRGSGVMPAGMTQLALAGAGPAPISINITGPVYASSAEDRQALAWEIVREIRRRRR
jgi:hypothetical protein